VTHLVVDNRVIVRLYWRELYVRYHVLTCQPAGDVLSLLKPAYPADSEATLD